MSKDKAIHEKAKWLHYCLQIGFPKSDLDELSAIWDRFKDEHGNIRKQPITQRTYSEQDLFDTWNGGYDRAWDVSKGDLTDGGSKNQQQFFKTRFGIEKHGLTGLSKVFEREYANESDIKKGKFKPGTKFGVI